VTLRAQETLAWIIVVLVASTVALFYDSDWVQRSEPISLFALVGVIMLLVGWLEEIYWKKRTRGEE